MGYKDIALPLVARGIPVIRLRPRSKIAMDKGWPGLATTDVSVIETWHSEMPDANCAAVAKAVPGGVWFLDVDDPDLPVRVEQETGHTLPKTYRVRSSPGRGHYYFRQSAASINLGNVAQGFVKGDGFSVRISNEYVVSERSIHPNTGEPYEAVSTADVAETPDWLIDWIKSQKIEQKLAPVVLNDEENIVIPTGSRNVYLTSRAGMLRQAGSSYEEMLPVVSRFNRELCNPPLDQSEVNIICNSVSKYPVKNNIVLVNGVIPGVATPIDMEPEEELVFDAVPHPKFPVWVMKQTSIYKGLVEPYCSVNPRYEEFMFMPAMVLLLNSLALKVRVEKKNLNLSIYMVMVGRRGELFKSSSVEDAITYFSYAGLVNHGSNRDNAEGLSLVFTPGSPEGFGMEMNRVNCTNGIMFFDELSTLTNKASIESSTLTSRLLTLYESGKFENLIKDKKKCFSLDPGSYCASLIALSTDENFQSNWSKLAGASTGLNDRFFFLYQPVEFKSRSAYTHVYTQEAAVETRRLVDKAIAQGIYSITDSSPLHDFLANPANSTRTESRVEKFALAFAVDLGRDEIDEDCIERALALAKYEKDVKNYLATFESLTREGMLQQEIVHFLQRSNGEMDLRELERKVHAERYGTSLWIQSLVGLIKVGRIVQTGVGTKVDPKKIKLLRTIEKEYD